MGVPQIPPPQGNGYCGGEKVTRQGCTEARHCFKYLPRQKWFAACSYLPENRPKTGAANGAKTPKKNTGKFKASCPAHTHPLEISGTRTVQKATQTKAATTPEITIPMITVAGFIVNLLSRPYVYQRTRMFEHRPTFAGRISTGRLSITPAAACVRERILSLPPLCKPMAAH